MNLKLQSRDNTKYNKIKVTACNEVLFKKKHE